MGALVCAPRKICDFLINRARPFIYSTGPSPLMAVAVRHALGLLRTEPGRRERLHALIGLAHRAFESRCARSGPGSQIIPCIVGGDHAATALAARMQERGYDIRAIRPPTVPEGTARLRISLTLHVGEAEIEAMFEVLGAELEALAI
jgi:8-amino-7-oxononanoate synthase